jgi:uncharacterized protein
MRTLLTLAAIAFFGSTALAQTDVQAQRDAQALGCAAGKLEDCRSLMRHTLLNPAAEDTFAPVFDKARAVFEAACNRGDASESGCYGAGTIHSLTGPENMMRAALTFYERSCDGGYAGGCTQVGNLYTTGAYIDVPWDIERAIAAFERGCSAGDAGGCSIVAKVLEGAPDIPADATSRVPRDLRRAASLYQKACDLGAMPECRRLAEMYERGLGVRKDAARAGKLYARACAGGEKDACARGKGTHR